MTKDTPAGIDLDQLKRAIPIIDLAHRLGLQVRGRQARCFNGDRHKHQDKHFSLGLDLKTNRFKCFACGVNGSIIDLYKKVKGVDVSQAIRDLADMAGLQDSKRGYKSLPKQPYKGQDTPNKKPLPHAGGIYYELRFWRMSEYGRMERACEKEYVLCFFLSLRLRSFILNPERKIFR